MIYNLLIPDNDSSENNKTLRIEIMSQLTRTVLSSTYSGLLQYAQ